MGNADHCQEQGGMAPLRIDEVKVAGEMGRRIDLTIQKNFLALDADKLFLDPCRQQRLVSEVKSAFERAVMIGHLLEAAALFAKYTNDPQVIARKNYLAAEAVKTQSAEGYIGIFQPLPEAKQLFSEYCFHEVAFIVLGLATDFLQFQEQRSLEAARRMAEYIMANWPYRPQDYSFTTEGISEGFMALYEATGEERYLRFAADEKMGKRAAVKPAPLREWEQDIFPRGWRDWKEWEGKAEPIRTTFSICHMVRVLERCMSQLRLHRLEAEEKLERMPRKVYSLLVRRERPGMLITGATGMSEGWQENQDGTGDSGETCATVYLLWLLEELLRLEADLRYGDVMERAIYNALFAAQGPEGWHLRYFTPFSGKRKYFEWQTYCCPHLFRRGIAHLPGHIYYHSGPGVAVNLYTASQANMTLENGVSVSLRQETDYPTSGQVKIGLEVSQPAQFPLRLRIPRWCERYGLKVNGAPAEAVSVPGGIEFNRVWKSGDQITLEMPMSWRLVGGRELQEGRAALLRGPVIYCLSREKNELPEDMNLRDITIDPASLGNPVKDESLRPSGLACRMKAWSPGRELSAAPDLDLLFTEFPDPTGEEIYFKVPEGAATVDDELIEA